MAYPDTSQLPTKAKPWSTLLSQDYIHKIDLVLPEEVLQSIEKGLINDTARAPGYHRVIMTLGQVLERDFFTQYIKIGNIMMLSEGNVDTNNVFSIRDGKLMMYLDKETYERAGLSGKPHGVKGARGLQPRWVVEYDLRSPAALHGKKGFDRLVYACKNALTEPTTWLFCNLSITPDLDPIVQHHPTKYTSSPTLIQNMAVQIPPLGIPSAVLADQTRRELDEYATEVYEWLSLIRLESPRVRPDDDMDPYLSTYTVPGDPSARSKGRLCKISWQGFIPPSWAASALAELIQTLPPRAWFSFSTTPFTRVAMGHGADYTIMRPPSSSGEYVLWEIKGHE
ncbi:putative ribonuclease P 40kDa subunit [Rosellinia necatrix]|uniref:Putative ribonuclease P 40kDa subunit n=1 Tax=Rosellinia necatrix TaxID=77044 RepID=A0A1W2TT79_ROSNE|nr:putative ribonuclease P 40kDa subunit [Rosellinia necatrix]